MSGIAPPPSNSIKQFFSDIYNNPLENKSKIALVVVVVALVIFIIISIIKRAKLPSTTPPLPFKERVTEFFKNVYHHPGDNMVPVGIIALLGLGIILGPIYLIRRHLEK